MSPRAEGGDRRDATEGDRFEGLDLLRGVAAVAVVLYHLSSRVGVEGLCGHGYLAVDFFFGLSGFVLARAYEERLTARTLSLARFTEIRLIRLLPLIVLGTVFAALVEIGRPGVADQPAHLGDVVAALVFGCLLVPMGRTGQLEPVAFPLNGPAWSLSLEMMANGAFALAAHLGVLRAHLRSVILACGLMLVWAILRFGRADFGSTPETFWFGLVRIGWSFSVGLWLYGFRARAPRFPFAVPVFGLCLVLMAPRFGALDPFLDGFSILFVFPALILLAAPARFGPVPRALCDTAGALSYPLYATHYPLARMLSVAATALHASPTARGGLVGVGLVLSIAVAALVHAAYDVPVRRALGKWSRARSRIVRRAARSGQARAAPSFSRSEMALRDSVNKD